MLVVFPPIFVADTKIIHGYNIVAPLNHRSEKSILKVDKIIPEFICEKNC